MRKLFFVPALLGLLACEGSLAQSSFPNRPVTIIVATAPGASNDIESRLYGEKLAAAFGQPFVVDYKPGAGTSASAAYVAKAAPDGHTLLCISSSFSAAAALYRNLSFDPLKDLAPITIASKRYTVIVAHPAASFRNLREYSAYSKANPGKINVATTGPGSGPHINAAWLHSIVNTEVTYVHYKSAAAMQSDLLSGRVDVTYGSLITGLPHIKSGKTRLLAIANNERSPLYPDIPTAAEQGAQGYNYASITGYIAPAGVPAPVLSRLNSEWVKATKAPDIVKRLEAEGGIPVGSTPAELGQLLASEIPRYRKLVDAMGITAEP